MNALSFAGPYLQANSSALWLKPQAGKLACVEFADQRDWEGRVTGRGG
jgi:hypothetical protein